MVKIKKEAQCQHKQKEQHDHGSWEPELKQIQDPSDWNFIFEQRQDNDA